MSGRSSVHPPSAPDSSNPATQICGCGSRAAKRLHRLRYSMFGIWREITIRGRGTLLAEREATKTSPAFRAGAGEGTRVRSDGARRGGVWRASAAGPSPAWETPGFADRPHDRGALIGCGSLHRRAFQVNLLVLVSFQLCASFTRPAPPLARVLRCRAGCAPGAVPMRQRISGARGTPQPHPWQRRQTRTT